MKHVVIILLLSVSCFASGCGTGYGFARTVTIDHTTVPATLANFPFLLQGTFTWTKSVANGGQVQHTGAGFTAPSIPDDLIFCDSPAGTQLPHEVDNYDATTGVAGFWISIPSLSSTVDTVIYAYYGKASVSTSQEQAPTLWANAGYVAVYHMTDMTAPNQKDSAGSNDLAWIGVHNAATGQIGGAVACGSTNGCAAKSSPTGLPSGTAARSVEVWSNFGGSTGNNPPYIFGYGNWHCGTFTCGGYGESFGIGSGEQGGPIPLPLGVYNTPGAYTFGDGSGIYKTAGYSVQAWHKIIGSSAVGNSDAHAMMLFIDGAQITGGSLSVATSSNDAINTTLSEIRVGACLQAGDSGGTSCFSFQPIDEARIANTVFSANWNQYEYCNDTGSCTATIGPPIVADDEPQIFITT